MKNPYEVLRLPQDAAEADINLAFKQAQMANLKTKEFSLTELSQARVQLVTPAKRLAADFLYPARPRAKRPRPFAGLAPEAPVSLAELSPDAHDAI